jgi:hypothetical protein
VDGSDARPRFEPTDLALEQPGVIELDTQWGAFVGRGTETNRLFAPDFELDVGLLPRLEIDLDGTVAVERFDARDRAAGGDSWWASAKLGLFDAHDAAQGRGWASASSSVRASPARRKRTAPASRRSRSSARRSGASRSR